MKAGSAPISYFLYQDGVIHSVFERMKSTLDTKVLSFTSENGYVETDDGFYPLHDTLEDLVKAYAAHFADRYLFVDNDGLIHSVVKGQLSDCTYRALSPVMEARIEQKDTYCQITFVDPAGEIEDDDGYVIHEPNDLAKLLDSSWKNKVV